MLSVTVFSAVLGGVRFLAHVLAGWRPSHANELPSEDSRLVIEVEVNFLPTAPMTRISFSVWQLRGSLSRGRVCNLLVQWLLRLARRVTLVSKSRRTHDPMLLSHMRLPQPGGPRARICIPQEQMAQLYPRALGPLFVACYDSQTRNEVKSSCLGRWARRTAHKTLLPTITPLLLVTSQYLEMAVLAFSKNSANSTSARAHPSWRELLCCSF
jgi:hypothetical protein